MPADTLTLTDNRTAKTYEVAIKDGAIKATDLRQIKVDADDFGLMTYDPAFMNTAACKSRITFIDGDRGILNYRGYPIEQLGEGSYVETAYLLLHGELPNAAQMAEFNADLLARVEVPAFFDNFFQAFEQSAHTMSMWMASLAALSAANPGARKVLDPAARHEYTLRGIAQVLTLAAYAHRRAQGLAIIKPKAGLGLVENFLHMLFDREPNPVLVKALDVLFILHADHEQNCSTSTMRLVGSSQVDPFTALAAAAGALFGPLHGGANEAVLKMLRHIRSVENIPAFIEGVKKGEGRLMGFGHRVYKNYDPRARIVKQTADRVFEVTGKNPLLDIAVELERIALSDEYFVKRRLYPNVDFYSGLIYEAMGFPVEMFTVLFGVARTSGWLSQWEELICDDDQKIGRPRQLYLGEAKRDYVPLASRG